MCHLELVAFIYCRHCLGSEYHESESTSLLALFCALGFGRPRLDVYLNAGSCKL
jgi:hypothetical protein